MSNRSTERAIRKKHRTGKSRKTGLRKLIDDSALICKPHSRKEEVSRARKAQPTCQKSSDTTVLTGEIASVYLKKQPGPARQRSIRVERRAHLGSDQVLLKASATKDTNTSPSRGVAYQSPVIGSASVEHDNS